jgi:DnaJ-class molecular chaperone
LAQDPYTVLGVARGASADDVRKAFRKLAKRWHPDANPGDKAAEEQFKRIGAAFDILGDVDKRRKYDAGEIDEEGKEKYQGFQGSPFEAGGNPFGGGAGPNPFGGGFSQGFQTRGEGIDLSEIFGGMFGRGGASGARGGGDTRTRLEIDLEDAIRGVTKRVAFSDGRTLDVNIPKGAVDGQTLRLRGASGRGDTLIELSLKPHPVFKREGDNLSMDLMVPLAEAVLGGKARARTPEGVVNLNIPKGSNSGTVLRLKGKGLYTAKGTRGDLLVRVLISLPEAPDPALEEYARKARDAA